MTTHNIQNVTQATPLDMTNLEEVHGGMAWLGAFGPLIIVAIAEQVKAAADKEKETAK